MFNEYFENGYSVIPVAPNGKNPAIMEWTKYCAERPTPELVDAWEQYHTAKNRLNIGITCGPASGIMVVDIDTDDKDFLALCPPSPVRRRGAKGEARVFKYNPEIRSQSFPGLDILADGRQFLVPPSIHPVTQKPYVWLTEDTLENTQACDLPTLDVSFLELITPLRTGVKVGAGGRNNKIVEMITAMRCRGESEAKILYEVYNWDLLYNQPRLFTDRAEGYPADSEDQAKKNALKMVASVSRSLIAKGMVPVKDAKDDGKIVVIENNEEEERVEEEVSLLSYPDPTGLMGEIKQLIEEMSERYMPNIAIGGAVSLMSAICSNRYRFDQCWPNTYVLNLAPTGAGKSFPQQGIQMILDQEIDSGLIGYGNYQSSAAFTKNLVGKRERLDIIDEISSLFAHMKGGGLYQQGIVDEMCKVWSASSGKFAASEYAEREDLSTCYNPCVSILGSSTIEGIKGNISKMMTVKGLLPRFLIFAHNTYGSTKNSSVNEKLLREICEKVASILKIEKRKKEDRPFGGPIYNPIDLTPDAPEAIEYFQQIRAELSKRVEIEPSLPIKDMLTRGKEQTMKLATIHAAGNFRKINLQDLVWARKTWDICLLNCTDFIQETAVDNDWERDLIKVQNQFTKRRKFVSLKFLSDRLRSIHPQRLNQLAKHLENQAKIEPATSRGAPGWKLVNSSDANMYNPDSPNIAQSSWDIKNNKTKRLTH